MPKPVGFLATARAFFGAEPSAVTAALWGAIRRFGDRGKRLLAVEVGALIGLEYDRALGPVLKESEEDTLETLRLKNRTQAALLEANRNVYFTLARASDTDGSLGDEPE